MYRFIIIPYSIQYKNYICNVDIVKNIDYPEYIINILILDIIHAAKYRLALF